MSERLTYAIGFTARQGWATLVKKISNALMIQRVSWKYFMGQRYLFRNEPLWVLLWWTEHERATHNDFNMRTIAMLAAEEMANRTVELVRQLERDMASKLAAH